MSGDLFDLSGKNAIVTGTSRGLGQAMARSLARAGADLVLTSRNRSSLNEFKSEIESPKYEITQLTLFLQTPDPLHRPGRVR